MTLFGYGDHSKVFVLLNTDNERVRNNQKRDMILPWLNSPENPRTTHSQIKQQPERISTVGNTYSHQLTERITFASLTAAVDRAISHATPSSPLDKHNPKGR
jgi:hypothetical protein